MEINEAQRISDRVWRRETARRLIDAGVDMLTRDAEEALKPAAARALPVPLPPKELPRNWNARRRRTVDGANVAADKPAAYGRK